VDLCEKGQPLGAGTGAKDRAVPTTQTALRCGAPPNLEPKHSPSKITSSRSHNFFLVLSQIENCEIQTTDLSVFLRLMTTESIGILTIKHSSKTAVKVHGFRSAHFLLDLA